MMNTLTQRRRAAVSELLRDSIVHLCRLNSLFDGQIEVDGIICISGQGEGEEIVVKVHERLQNTPSTAPFPFGVRTHPFASRPPPPADKTRVGAMWGGPTLGGAMLARDDASALKAALRQTSSLLPTAPEQEPLREPEDLRKIPRTMSAASVLLPGGRQATSPYPDDEDRSMMSSPGSNLSPGDAAAMNGGQGSDGASPYSHKSRWPSEFNAASPECHICFQSFDNFDLLSDHNETLHNSFTCAFCLKTFTSRSNLERHSRLHTGHKPFACTICNRAFSRKDHLSNHASKHAFKCGACAKRFADRLLLTNHFFQEHNSTTVNVCQFCNKGFADYSAYEEHAKVHPQFNLADKNFNLPAPLFMLSRPRLQCRSCSYVAADKLSLSKHQLVHQDPTRTYSCLACTKTFSDPILLAAHMDLHGQETNVFECIFCHQVLPSLQLWKRHELSHAGGGDNGEEQQTHSCHQCDKVFLSQSHLLEHLAVHDFNRQPFPSPSWMKTILGQSEDGGKDKRKHQGDRTGDVVGTILSGKSDEPRASAAKAAKAREEDIVVMEKSVIEVKQEPSKNGSLKSRKQERPQKLKKELSSMGWDMSLVSPLLAISAMAGNHTLEYRPPAFYPSPTPNMAMDLTQRSSEYTPPDDMSNDSRRNISVSSTPSKMNVDIPAGPHTCTLCNGINFDSFTAYESHCITDHNRSPCMFCVKTFAQKANRDRHVCLHTGDKPYACPYCNERFSRGDKLKLHKTRVHKIGEPQCASPEGSLKFGVDSKLLAGMGLLDSEGVDMGQPEGGSDWPGREDNGGSFYSWNGTNLPSSLNVHEAGEWRAAEVMDARSDADSDEGALTIATAPLPEEAEQAAGDNGDIGSDDTVGSH